ncbi:N-acyl-phosphatidylethanolamine-hydrolyzing phospholipase D [Sparassis crispa]|uniref:N-acyl-phosphatidylethanolamine-hydrolyzing phospholipase D n=1 Tax=Sparassis crispa TaxID=139825 RepID=A0A401GFC9_9APHY|nr:N-acyl-phosphatidylethanolamine-hydrolyzing phospholipase D [Sparassis crispa]GBE80835.1 N-acyl-phosphatidylethanolamine-hydrolyzing phospholipase D [Sparassis crispa]
MSETIVQELPSRLTAERLSGRPEHHLDDTKSSFRNPWPSFRFPALWQWVSFFTRQATSRPRVPDDLSDRIPTHEPTWGKDSDGAAIKATWLGHACYLIELPTPPGGSRGPRILTDPVMSQRCAPVQWAGPERLVPAPCSANNIPVVDAIVISHNHYDHMDASTLRVLYERHHPHVFAPLGNLQTLREMGISRKHIHILDWWDARSVTVPLSPSSSAGNTDVGQGGERRVDATFRITCTPSQHTANRSLFDRWRSLWSSWAIEELKGKDELADTGKKVYFGGDTGYRTVRDGEDEEKVPVCPAFSEIGERFGSFDLALLPIGAYAPRTLFSNLHVNPYDSVRIFQDIRAKKALAMHWGTWILTTEPIMEPPLLLRKACAEAGLKDSQFDICGLGETRVI